MSELKEKIGQMIIIGLKDEKLTQEERSVLREYSFRGFSIFKDSLSEPKRDLLYLYRQEWYH